jgi:voltage-gated potassium channel
MTYRKRIHDILDPNHHQGRLSKAANYLIYSLIFLSVLVIVLDSVPSIYRRCSGLFWYFELLVVIVFSVEYLLRLWCCVESPKYASPLTGRLKYLLSPLALVDLMAVLPFYLPFVTADMLFLRAIRFFRLFRVAKLGRYSTAFRVLAHVVYTKRAELIVSLSMVFFLTVLSAIGMFYAEHEAQPQVFPDALSSMFWAIATLTNVSHPYPITPLGKCLASAICILGLAMLALPTGVLGAGFVEEFQRRHRQPTRCPHCGKDIHAHGDSKPAIE